jgi:hypothetical protein
VGNSGECFPVLLLGTCSILKRGNIALRCLLMEMTRLILTTDFELESFKARVGGWLGDVHMSFIITRDI